MTEGVSKRVYPNGSVAGGIIGFIAGMPQLGVAIWQREGRRLRPTQAGEFLLAVANRLAPQRMVNTVVTNVPGSRVRNLHVAVVLSSLETKRYALPAYVLAYQYRGKVYRVVVHGQDAGVGAAAQAGKRPARRDGGGRER